MKILNGVRIFEGGEEIVFPVPRPPLPDGTKARFGFELSVVDGGEAWVEGSEHSLRSLLASLNLPNETIENMIAQRREMPLTGPACNVGNNRCTGDCGQLPPCGGYVNENGTVTACLCGFM